MKGILGDANIDGHIKLLAALLAGEPWLDFWRWLDLHIYTFADLGLARNAPDSLVWHACQRESVILLTENRNNDGPDSLEAILRTHNTTTSLPVFTLANAPKFLAGGHYAQTVLERMLEYLMEIDNYRGTGRMFLP